MADSKISQLTPITGANILDSDEFIIARPSTFENFSVTRTEFFQSIPAITTPEVTTDAATVNGNITVTGTVDGRDVAADGSKLDGIESNATADQTALEIKTAYESNADTNAFTDAEQTKLSNIEALADVTDTTNVTAAGALMDSELTNIAAVKALDQGVATTDSPSFVEVTAAQYNSTEALPDIRPTLNLDFANTKLLDPRITYTRGSTATYYDGKTFAKAEENLLVRSQDYSTGWTVTNLTPVTGKTAPDGTTTATEFTASSANGVLTQGFAAIAGDYTFSVWLRRVTGTGDIQIAADNGTWNTVTITTTWVRYDVTQTVVAGAKTSGIRIVTSGDVIEVWGAQLEQRSALTDYTATTDQPITNYIPALQTAASGEPRFDHDPITGESKGFFIEEQRTNLVTYSEQFDNADWVKNNSSSTANIVVAPDGTLTGDKLVEDTENGEHYLENSVALSPAAGTYTHSVFVKAAERSKVQFRTVHIGSDQGDASFVTFNLIDGTSSGTSSAVDSASIEDVGNGWWRVSATVTTTGTVTDNRFRVNVVDDEGERIYTGDGYSGVYIWGAQLEQGAFPTSYIPTVASQVTRSEDNASMTGTNFSSWYRQDEGTVFVNYSAPNLGGLATTDPYVVGFSGGASASNAPRVSIRLEDADNSVGLQVVDASGSGVSTNITGGIPANLTDSRVSAAYAVDDFAISVFDNAVETDTSGYVPAGGITHLHLGHHTGSLNGHIKKVAYYPKRLSNATLQALTEE